MFARGSGDTKGNLVAQVAALRAFLAAGDPVPCNVKFVVEGEEEVGSPHFRSFVEANRSILKADGATIEGGDLVAPAGAGLGVRADGLFA